MKHKIISSANKKILFLAHAVSQASHPDRMITADQIKQAVLVGEIIEEYPKDQRGKSCLIFHAKQDRVIHVVFAPKNDYLAIITAYVPAADQWSSDFKVRR